MARGTGLVLLFAGLSALTTTALARPPQVRVTPAVSTTANELCVAINPADPNEIAIGANLNFHFASTDGGSTWIQRRLSSSLGVWGDPSLVFDDEGHLYYAHLSNPPDGSWIDRIVVQKSTDGGLTWTDGTGVGLNPPAAQDKEWLAVDRTASPWRNNLYMAWTEFDEYGSADPADSTRILFARSDDRGLSWSTPQRISERGGNCVDADLTVEGAVPAVGPEGQVYLAWSGHDEIRFDRSLDGGETFGRDVLVTSQPGGWDFEVPGVYRCNGLPITACDRSGSPYRGRVYVLFSDQRHGTDDTDVFLCTSDDGGLAWSSPRRVNDDLGASHQFFPWMSVDPVTGRVAVVFYDRRAAVGAETGVTVAVSDDGGQSFVNLPLPDVAFTPWETVFFGDYIGIDAHAGVVHVAWLAMDDGLRSVWTSRLAFPTGAGGAPVTDLRLVMRTPASTGSGRTKISFVTWQDAGLELAVYDLRGRRVRSLISEFRPAGVYDEQWDGTDAAGRPVASGIYVARLVSGDDVVTRKVVVVN